MRCIEKYLDPVYLHMVVRVKREYSGELQDFYTGNFIRVSDGIL